MRVEPHGVGSVMHVIKRGARGMEIVRDLQDRYNFVRSLYLLNDTHQDDNWRTYVVGKPLFYRPEAWPEKKPLVSILAWTLLDNHFHLLLQESEENGIAKFMHRLGGSMTRSFNKKYDERGSIFQGAYKGRRVDSDEYLHYVHAYIVVKNTFETYPGGLNRALSQFESAWKYAEKYQFSSFITAADGTASPLLDMSAIASLGLVQDDFKKFSRSMLMINAQTRADKLDERLAPLLLEDW